jgi:hypothetical protein
MDTSCANPVAIASLELNISADATVAMQRQSGLRKMTTS